MSIANSLLALTFPEGWNETTVFTFEGPRGSGVQHNLVVTVNRHPTPRAEKVPRVRQQFGSGPSWRLAIGTLVVVAQTGLGRQTGAASVHKEDGMNGVNMRGYGAIGNNAALGFATALQGNVVWKKPASSGNSRPSSHISISGEQLLVATGGTVEAFARKNGSSAWVRPVGPGALLVDDRGIVFVNDGDRIVRLSPQGETSEQGQAPFAGMGTLMTLYEKAGELRYCYTLPPQQITNPGDPVVGPQFSYVRYSPPENDIRWEFTRTGALRSVFHVIDMSRLCIVDDKHVYLLNTDGSSDRDVQSLACNEAYGAGADTKGALYVVLDETITKHKKPQRMTSLSCFDTGFKPRWRYVFGNPPRIAQPPAVLDDGSVYLLSNGSLLKVRESALLWSMPLPCEWDKSRLSVMSDNSVPVAAGRALLHISDDGQELRKMFFEDVLTCRPITDELKRVYVAGSKMVFCVE